MTEPGKKRRNTRLAGHGLPNEGRVYDNGWEVRVGAARCQCGWSTPELDSVAARRWAHYEHKVAVALEQSGAA